MGDVCYKEKGSCKTCESYKYDSERNSYACFARINAKEKANGNALMEDYYVAIAMGDKTYASLLKAKLNL